MNVRLAWALVVVTLVLAPQGLLSHHSRAAEFDERLPVSFQGVVSHVDWRNPHIWIFIDETRPDGEVLQWEAEAAGNPISMARNGWRADTLKPGDPVLVEGIRAYCCDNVMSIGSIRRPDGDALFEGRAAR